MKSKPVSGSVNSTRWITSRRQLAIVLGIGGELSSLGQAGLAECRGHLRHPLVGISVSEGEMKPVAAQS